MLPFVLVVLAVAAMGAGTVVALDRLDDPLAGCAETIDVRIAAAEEMSPLLGEATRDLESSQTDVGGACVDYEVEIAAANEFLEIQAAADEDEAADLWVPDFSVWTSRTALSGLPLATLSQSIATSPVVVVSPEGKQPDSWAEVGMSTVAYLDPLTSSTSTVALLSAFGEAARTGATRAELGAMMVPLAQRYGAQPDKPETPSDVAQAASKGTFGVMTEQQLVSLQSSGKGKGLSPAVPKSGTMMLDYPLTAVSQDESVKEGGRMLAEYLSSPRGQELLAVHGFRGPESEPLGSGKGLGSAELNPIPPPSPDQVTGAMRQWEVLTVPSRSLAVVDVSGSMDFTDRSGRKRISLAVSAAQGAMKLFPDNAELGLWAFSVGLGGGNQDYLSLLPVRPLGGTSGGVSHRESLAEALKELPTMTAGGTGLYDTTLAAVRSLRADYDENAVNTVILLTDGKNEDRGSLSLKELLSKLERERDPGKPLEIIAIGMGPQADAKALERIANATEGKSYIARDPSDIAKVFIDAMLNR